jgi:hypothetical protein
MKNQISASTIANLPIDEAWVKLSDLGKAHYYVPDLTASQITTENHWYWCQSHCTQQSSTDDRDSC